MVPDKKEERWWRSLTVKDCPKCIHYRKEDGLCHLPDLQDPEDCVDECMCYEEG